MGIRLLFGRGAAVRREVEHSRDVLYRVAFAWCHDAQRADDLVHEAIEKALRNAAQLRDPKRLRGWLFRILANCLRDQQRARRDEVALDAVEERLVAAGPTPEEAHESAELVVKVRLAVARLPFGQRQVVTLVDLEGCSYSETSEALGIPVGTVMSRLCRARQALRTHLAPLATEQSETKLRSVK